MTNFAITALIFLPVLFYPPILFTSQINASLRIGLFILLIIYLFFAVKRFRKKDLFISVLLVFLLFGLLYVNFGNSDGLRTAGNMILTLSFAYALSRAVEMNARIKKNLINLYTIFFTLVPICSLLSVLFFLIFGEFNLFNIPPSEEGYNYLNTPFGVMLDKNFFGFSTYRSFFFFTEPVYLALFYAANIFFLAPYLKQKPRFFVILNIIGGFLTFSYLFFILAALFFLTKTNALSRKYALRPLLMIGLIAILPMVDVFAASSLSDRTYRMNLFFTSMTEANVFQLMLGRGFAADTGFDRGFAGGLFTTIYEAGAINLVVIMFFIFVLSNKNKHIFLVFFAAMLAFEPIKLPLFWMMVVVLSVLLSDKRHIKSTSISQRSLLQPKNVEM